MPSSAAPPSREAVPASDRPDVHERAAAAAGSEPATAVTPIAAAVPHADTVLRDEVARAAADFGDASDLVDAAAADALGVNRTDLRILGLLRLAGALAAGALAEAAALSPAATSTAIQRLVAAGHLVREVDPRDRRRAVVTITTVADTLLERMYGPIRHAGLRELSHYTAEELAVVLDFLRRGRRMQLREAARIRTLTDRPDRVGP